MDTRKRLSRGAKAAALIGLGSMIAAPEASAHYINPGWFKVYDDQQTCTWSLAEIGHDSRAPYVRGGVYATQSIGVGPLQVLCNNNPDASNVAIGYLTVATNLQKVVNGVTAVCVDNGFRSNGAVVDEFYVKHVYAAGAAPCGSGDYEARSWSYVMMNGVWNGGPIRSGNHALPIAAGK